MLFMFLWLLSQVKVAKDGRHYLVVNGEVKYFPKGVITQTSKVICTVCNDTGTDPGFLMPCQPCARRSQSVVSPQEIRPMTEKQIAFIRSLFLQLSQFLTEEQKETVVTKMKGHIHNGQPQSTKWASGAINKFLAIAAENKVVLKK